MDPAADYSLQEHVANGSRLETQFISLSKSKEVAMFYAIKGAVELDARPARVAEVELFVPDRGETLHDVARYLYAFQDPIAVHYARTFREVCVERQIYPDEVIKVYEISENGLNLFEEGGVGPYRHFLSNYRASRLPMRLKEAESQYVIKVTTSIVGCHHPPSCFNIRYLSAMGNIRYVQLVREPRNWFDSNAIRVEAVDQSRQIGYICAEHSRLLVAYTDFTNVRFRVALPDQNTTVYELPLEVSIQFRTRRNAEEMIHDIADAAGKCGIVPFVL